MLPVEPTYKPYWEIPGGAEAEESPRDAVARELKEELGLSCPISELLAIDRVPPQPDRTEGLMVVFLGNVPETGSPGRRWQLRYVSGSGSWQPQGRHVGVPQALAAASGVEGKCLRSGPCSRVVGVQKLLYLLP